MSSSRPLDNPSPVVLQNPNPSVHQTSSTVGATRRTGARDEKALLKDLWASSSTSSGDRSSSGDEDETDEVEEQLDADEVFDLIRSVTDPEHETLTLEQLMVVYRSGVHVSNRPGKERVFVEFTPTIPHCSMATLIGLTLRLRLTRSLPASYRLDIRLKPGSHQSEHAINKQLNDKERCVAATENSHLLGVVEGCMSNAAKRGH